MIVVNLCEIWANNSIQTFDDVQDQTLFVTRVVLKTIIHSVALYK